MILEHTRDIITAQSLLQVISHHVGSLSTHTMANGTAEQACQYDQNYVPFTQNHGEDRRF
jgi:hypothetical protein